MTKSSSTDGPHNGRPLISGRYRGLVAAATLAGPYCPASFLPGQLPIPAQR